MRVIAKGMLVKFWEIHEQARKPLEEWWALAAKARWTNFDDVRRIFASSDQVKAKSGNTVYVFNIGGNKYRLIAAIHYKSQKVFIREVLTHEEYSKGTWKERS